MSWTPAMFEPPVRVWLDASNGYRSGSRPTVTSVTAAANRPAASRSFTKVAGGSPMWVTASPSFFQSAVTASATA